jgi:hypothetical protein
MGARDFFFSIEVFPTTGPVVVAVVVTATVSRRITIRATKRANLLLRPVRFPKTRECSKSRYDGGAIPSPRTLVHAQGLVFVTGLMHETVPCDVVIPVCNTRSVL